jgi:hypothetical protein
MKGTASKKDNPSGSQWNELNHIVFSHIIKVLTRCGVTKDDFKNNILGKGSGDILQRIGRKAGMQILKKCLCYGFNDFLCCFYKEVFDVDVERYIKKFSWPLSSEYDIFLLRLPEYVLSLTDIVTAMREKLGIHVDIERSLEDIDSEREQDRPDDLYLFGWQFDSFVDADTVCERPSDLLDTKMPFSSLVEYLLMQCFYRYTTGGLLDNESKTTTSSHWLSKNPRPHLTAVHCRVRNEVLSIIESTYDCSGNTDGMRRVLPYTEKVFNIRDHI